MLAIAAFAPSLAFNAALAPVVRPALAPRAAAPVAQIGFDKGMANFQVRCSPSCAPNTTPPPPPPRSPLTSHPSTPPERSALSPVAPAPSNLFSINFQADFPWLAKYGFGPSVKAERWNGRHAMFGWFMILSTAVMQKYGLFPNPDVPLQYKDWGAARTVEKGGERAPAVCPGGPRLAGAAWPAVGEGPTLGMGLRRAGWGVRDQGWRLLKGEGWESGPSSPRPRWRARPPL